MRRNPLVSYCVLFLLLTAIGVAGLRSDFGLAQAVSSRYTVYSALFLILAWFAIVEEFLEHSRVPLLRNSLPFSCRGKRIDSVFRFHGSVWLVGDCTIVTMEWYRLWPHSSIQRLLKLQFGRPPCWHCLIPSGRQISSTSESAQSWTNRLSSVYTVLRRYKLCPDRNTSAGQVNCIPNWIVNQFARKVKSLS